MRVLLISTLLLLSGSSVFAADEIVLFNGKDFSGWTFFLERKGINAEGKAEISDFVSVKPGAVIEITARGHGALMTETDYLNYKLHAEWRFVDPNGANNSGLLLRIRPPFVWDMEHGELAGMYLVQIMPPETGDLWVLGAFSESKLTTDPSRSFPPFGNRPKEKGAHHRRHVKLKNAEKPAGEWNSVDVTLNGKNITVVVNGEVVNEGTNLIDLPGRIGLECEFGTVQFRNLRLTPIDDGSVAR